MTKQIPFVDIYIDQNITEQVKKVLTSKRYVKGPILEEFETKFSNKCRAKEGIGVSNGTAALLLSMKALEIREGDEVFVPAHTYFATVSPVLELGATPRFVDIDPVRYTMDPDLLRESVEQAKKPEAIVVTHMHGQPAEMKPILDIAQEHGLTVIEDTAQAHLAEYQGTTVGAMGSAGCFSFYPTKNMTVGGDGGMIITDNQEVANTARALRNHGRDGTGEHVELGLNYRLDETSAAVGIEQLSHLPEWNDARRQAAARYDKQLGDVEPVKTPPNPEDSEPVYHHYAIQVPEGERDEFRSYLEENGVGTGIHYELAVHQHPAVAERVGEVNAPVAEEYCRRTVSLPIHPRITEEEINYVTRIVREYWQ
jgi:dTDP-4-amino-4,6-dideoxygalactose transaminase